MDDVWVPESTVKKPKGPKYRVRCKCGHEMRVRRKHFGRMCRCTRCEYPIYVTNDNVTPPLSAADKEGPRFFPKSDEVPVHWQKGDLLMELYEVKDTLGEGGMGTVYRVYHRGWGVNLAVKCPSARLLDDREWVEQFDHECETWINLSPHVNVVQCHYVRRLGGIPRVFVEYVHGRDLGHLIYTKEFYQVERRDRLKRMLDVAIQLAWGLHHAHREGLVHQDVKPGNLLVREDGTAKVTDFGLARVWKLDAHDSQGSGSVERKGLTGGTPTYRSPDQKIYGEVTHKTDIWSWGVSMIELFSGDIYWTQGSEAKQVLDNLLQYGSRYDIIPVMPKPIIDLLYQCFELELSRRPADMMEISNRLKAIHKEVTGEEYERPEPQELGQTIDTINNRAVSLLDLGKSEEAEALLEDAAHRDPSRIPARYNRGLHLWRSGKITDAQLVEMLYRMCHEFPEEWFTPYLLARVFIERGDSKVAIEILEGIPQTPENKRDVAFALAMAQNYLGRDKKLVWECRPEETRVSAVSLSFDGWRAVTGGVSGDVRIWDVQSAECITLMTGHTERVHSASLSEEERFVLSASADKTLKLWDPTSGRCLQTMKGHVAAVRAAVLTPNAKHAVSAGEDGTIMIWDASNGKCLRVLQGHRSGVNTVAVSRCGHYVYSGSRDCTVKQWDFWTGECLHTFTEADSRITSVAVSHDGTLLVGATGTDLLLWDVDAHMFKRIIRGHQTEIFSVCLNETGRYALSATGMGTIKIWDVTTGQCLRSLKGHSPSALSRDGRYAISAGKHSEFKVWEVHLDEQPFQAQYVICKHE